MISTKSGSSKMGSSMVAKPSCCGDCHIGGNPHLSANDALQALRIGAGKQAMIASRKVTAVTSRRKPFHRSQAPDMIHSLCAQLKAIVASLRQLSATPTLAALALLAMLSGSMGDAALPGVGQAQAAKLEGQRFDDTAVVSDRTLRLNGLGLRSVAWIKAFVAGLYLPAPTKDAAQALAMPGPKRLRLRMLMEVSSHEFSKAFDKGVRKNESDKTQAQLAPRMAAFFKVVDGLQTLRKGDTIDLDFTPGQGMQLRLNNKALGKPIEGEDFYRAILKIFIGERPVDKRMKEGLLGGRAES
jgi:Chalcone isomerase-like